MAGLYIHIPFCARKCSYCAFYSCPVTRELAEGFLLSLEREAASLPDGFAPDTIFIGGGTPTSLNRDELKRVLSLTGRFSPQEFSCEANPGTVEPQKLGLLREGGVNRLSLGVQSFDAQGLQTLGRIHSAEEACTAFRQARAAGFENIGVDLMFGLPGQSLETLEADLDRMLELGPEHVSIYNLMYEEGTPLAESSLPRLDEGLEREMYDRIRERLKRAGYIHYEISSFARPGFECRHNLLYWTGGEYIGIGPAAHSHWKGARRANASDLEGYLLNGPRCDFEERLEPRAKERETLVMGLRQIAGVDVSPELWRELEGKFRSLQDEKLLEIEGCRVRLSDEALFVSDPVFAELV
jgi:oxygen-independent coproporphyrinogen-3 oxidase